MTFYVGYIFGADGMMPICASANFAKVAEVLENRKDSHPYIKEYKLSNTENIFFDNDDISYADQVRKYTYFSGFLLDDDEE